MPWIYCRYTEFYFEEPGARFYILVKFNLCDSIPRGYLTWLLLNTRRQRGGSLMFMSYKDSEFALAVTFALLSTIYKSKFVKTPTHKIR